MAERPGELVLSDAREFLTDAFQRYIRGATWQRSHVSSRRNVLEKTPAKRTTAVKKARRDIPERQIHLASARRGRREDPRGLVDRTTRLPNAIRRTLEGNPNA